MAPVKKPPRELDRHYLQEWRQFRGFSQEDAASEIMISRASLSKIESGIIPYDQEKLERLARLYGCTPADLISRDPFEGEGVSLFDLEVGEKRQVQAYIDGIRASKSTAKQPAAAPISARKKIG